jgi:hypothetical protein
MDGVDSFCDSLADLFWVNDMFVIDHSTNSPRQLLDGIFHVGPFIITTTQELKPSHFFVSNHN